MTHNKVPEKPDNWINVGDTSPQRHGGIFVKWDNTHGYWHIIETRHPCDIQNAISEDSYRFEHMHLEPQEVWINGNPYEGFTEKTLENFDKFSSLPFTPLNPDSGELPEGESYESYVDWYIDEEWYSIFSYIVDIHRGHIHSTIDYFRDYWKYLDNHGIEKSDF
jgi:hypothetical protein